MAQFVNEKHWNSLTASERYYLLRSKAISNDFANELKNKRWVSLDKEIQQSLEGK